MHRIMKRLLSLGLGLLLAASLPATALAAEETGEAAAQAAVETAMTYGGAVSAQFALWEDGEITLSGTAGVYSKTENRLLTDENLYGVGSISKIYTTAAVMKLVEEGKVDLDEPVTTYLPDFRMADERYREITVRMLLNHSSGLMGTTNVDAFLLDDPDNLTSTQDLLDRLADQTLQADPGAYSVYCNDGFTLAQLVVERVSGQSFADFLRREITGPLGLEATFTPQDDFDRSLLAKTYLGTDPRALPPETLNIVGAGGIYASASDLAAFGGALCGEGLLSQASLEAMAAEECLRGMWPEDSQGSLLSYGLGWDAVELYPFSASGIQALVKGGDTLVYHAGLVVLPEYDMAAAVLTSGGVSTYNEMAAAQILVDALAARGITVEAPAVLEASAPAEMPAELTAWSGDYGSSAGLAEITVGEDGTLSLMVAGLEEPLLFTYRENGTFQDDTDTVAVRLVEEENGQVYLQQFGYTALPGLVPFYSAEYVYEKLPASTADEDTLAAWQAREGKLYALLDESYTSALYPFSSVFAGVSLVGSPEGYLSIDMLADENTAVPVLQIPGTGSRDGAAIVMTEEDGVEYLTCNGSTYRDMSTLEEIYAGSQSVCTILPDGYSRWYAVGDAAGQTMAVTLPADSGFCVYDAAFQLVAASHAYGDTQAVLPEGGWVVFTGDVGAQFQIAMDR